MSQVMNRKEFLSGRGIFGAWKRALEQNDSNDSNDSNASNHSAEEEPDRRKALAEYFQSPLYSYPLLQEMPWEFLLEEARKYDIPTEGRSKNDIVRDLFSQTL